MENDVIIPGIGTSPMTDIYDIKILICYILKSIDTKISKQQLNTVFQDGQYVNYFSFCDALQELIKSGHITAQKAEFDEVYTLNPLGVETADKLERALPTSLKDRVVAAAISLLSQTKLLKENQTEITPFQNGYNVRCVMHDENFDLLDFKLFVPDMMQAEKVKSLFLKDPVNFYKNLIALLLEV